MTAEEITKKIISVADRFGGDNAQQLKQLSFVLSKKDPEVVFEGLFGVLCLEDEDSYPRHQLAGALLYNLRPRVSFDLAQRIQSTLSSWDRSVEEWPWYLVDLYGLDRLLEATGQLAATSLTEAERTRLDTIVWWAKGFHDRGQGNTLGQEAQ